ncbi:hypothetical protein CHLRE_12g556228v5 [Chlamydomonas reinhardtii]|uniref:FAD/NAD(P)-binding domain-containing protein n=1 Tax=Chlamydomonas reinhardtii TaxID=3055 RepID=A8JHH4_CHLRE|nr:uncharacterized protein CHLRE_12g556228v5 [Chlamydomonas reinhardtii]PNW76355.1 hypothetical protein CHLRE_12g556228v5 [Chlamydomonas reinhardtii]|eukprot:XP_001703056.1 type-II NADH dehydrogenase [Chlamydomonas reinhardtii]
MAPKPRVLIIGGGFAGVTLAKKASAFADVTLVDSKSYFELTWTTVRGIVDPEVASRSAISYKDIPGMGRFVQATVTSLSAKSAVLSNGETLSFDYAALATGSSYSDTAFKSTASSSREQRLAELKALTEDIKASKSIVVVGGGPAGVEVAAEIVEAHAGKQVTLVHPGAQLLNGTPPKAGAAAKKWLESHRVTVLLNTSVQGKPEGRGPVSLTLDGKEGRTLAADVVLWCAGARPNTAFLQGGELAGCLDERGAVKVLPSLQVEGHPHMFALGDVNNVPEAKLGYLATEHGKLVAVSLKALISAKPGASPKLGAWKPGMGNQVMIVSLGRGDGVCRMNGNVCGGCLPASIKSKGLFVDDYRKQLGV